MNARVASAGVGLSECLVIEFFAGTGRVTACLKQLGMSSLFGTDCIQAMSQISGRRSDNGVRR